MKISPFLLAYCESFGMLRKLLLLKSLTNHCLLPVSCQLNYSYQRE